MHFDALGGIRGSPARSAYYKCVTFCRSRPLHAVHTSVTNEGIMQRLKVNPVVLERLRAAYPRPHSSASKALQKYQDLLESLLFQATNRRSRYEAIFNLFSIPVSKLIHEGPQIGGAKVRLHAWLQANDLALIEIVERGSNLTRRVSQVKLTPLATYSEANNELAGLLKTITEPSQLTEGLQTQTSEAATLFHELYPDYHSYLSTQARDKSYDHAPIDIPSLEAYIHWINTEATKKQPAQIADETQTALTVHQIASYANGYLPQRKKVSEFGRTYYQGISVQNVNKSLRRAMLGNCWQYDIRSSVISWKAGFAREIGYHDHPTKDYSRLFWATLWYVEKKNEFMRDVRRETFGPNCTYPVEFQENLIKRARTAISFGARANSQAWRIASGGWEQSALKDIMTNSSDLSSFLRCDIVKQFIAEQAMFDRYLANQLKQILPQVYFGPLVKPKIQPSRAKAVAYLYQHCETEVMRVAYRILGANGIVPIAKIHDAFIVRKKLPSELRLEIIISMREETGNDYWNLVPEELLGFVFKASNY